MSVWQTPQAWTSTTTSPGPGSGTTTGTSSTGASFERAITPAAVWGIGTSPPGGVSSHTLGGGARPWAAIDASPTAPERRARDRAPPSSTSGAPLGLDADARSRRRVRPSGRRACGCGSADQPPLVVGTRTGLDPHGGAVAGAGRGQAQPRGGGRDRAVAGERPPLGR